MNLFVKGNIAIKKRKSYSLKKLLSMKEIHASMKSISGMPQRFFFIRLLKRGMLYTQNADTYRMFTPIGANGKLLTLNFHTDTGAATNSTNN